MLNDTKMNQFTDLFKALVLSISKHNIPLSTEVKESMKYKFLRTEILSFLEFQRRESEGRANVLKDLKFCNDGVLKYSEELDAERSRPWQENDFCQERRGKRI